MEQWLPKNAEVFDCAKERFPGFTWEPVTQEVSRGDGSVVIRRFVRFTRFPTVEGRTLTVKELLTVDPATLDPPRVKTPHPVRTDWRGAQRTRRAARREGMFA